MAETTTGGNLLTRKIGPLPGYGWLLITVAVGYLYFRHAAKSAASSSDATSADGTPYGSSLAPDAYSSPTYSPAPPVINITVPSPTTTAAPISSPIQLPPASGVIGPRPVTTTLNPVTAPVDNSPLPVRQVTIGPAPVDTLPIIRPA